MKLSSYLTTKKITSQKFASKMGISVSSVNKYRMGIRIPHWRRAAKIEKATKGSVRLRDWR